MRSGLTLENVRTERHPYQPKHTCQVMQRTSTEAGDYAVTPIARRDGGPLQEVMEEIVDITEYLDFSFYAHVSYKENAGTRHELGEAD
jgi:hypothetical protein